MPTPDQKYCTECGTPMPRAAEICPACGSPQRAPSKWTPARIAIGCLIAAGSVLVLFLVIGIFAAIAIPKFANTKEKAYMAAMRADLRNMMTAQEVYFQDHGRYATRLDELPNFVLTTGVQLAGPILADSAGWTATVGHQAVQVRCTVAIGAAVSPGSPEGEPFCRGPARDSSASEEGQ